MKFDWQGKVEIPDSLTPGSQRLIPTNGYSLSSGRLFQWGGGVVPHAVKLISSSPFNMLVMYLTVRYHQPTLLPEIIYSMPYLYSPGLPHTSQGTVGFMVFLFLFKKKIMGTAKALVHAWQITNAYMLNWYTRLTLCYTCWKIYCIYKCLLKDFSKLILE